MLVQRIGIQANQDMTRRTTNENSATDHLGVSTTGKKNKRCDRKSIKKELHKKIC